jgi:hypothetical protein
MWPFEIGSFHGRASFQRPARAVVHVNSALLFNADWWPRCGWTNLQRTSVFFHLGAILNGAALDVHGQDFSHNVLQDMSFHDWDQ